MQATYVYADGVYKVFIRGQVHAVCKQVSIVYDCDTFEMLAHGPHEEAMELLTARRQSCIKAGMASAARHLSMITLAPSFPVDDINKVMGATSQRELVPLLRALIAKAMTLALPESPEVPLALPTRSEETDASRDLLHRLDETESHR
jgi:hypothetical protein